MGVEYMAKSFKEEEFYERHGFMLEFYGPAESTNK